MSDHPLAPRFRRFAVEASSAGSPIYAELARACAGEPWLLDLVARHVPPGQPPTNLLFAAVHFLLQEEPDAPLRAFYPSLAADGARGGDLVATFLDFARTHASAVARLCAERAVQTNEVRRSVFVAQACAWAARRAGRDAVALIEVGTSAGLLLAFDRYEHRLRAPSGAVAIVGARGAAVALDCEWRSDHAPLELPRIASRIGLDRRVVRSDDERDRRWLRALVWPEHRDRLALLDAALREVAACAPTLVEGNASATLPTALAGAPADAALVVFHAHVLHQMEERDRKAIDLQLFEAARTRPLFRVGDDLLPDDGQVAPLLLQHAEGTRIATHHLANVHGHARRVDWIAP